MEKLQNLEKEKIEREKKKQDKETKMTQKFKELE